MRPVGAKFLAASVNETLKLSAVDNAAGVVLETIGQRGKVLVASAPVHDALARQRVIATTFSGGAWVTICSSRRAQASSAARFSVS